MSYSTETVATFGRLLADSSTQPSALIEAASVILQFQAAICVINCPRNAPVYICDSFEDSRARAAVQRYTRSTYLINPVYNAYRSGLATGLYRMRDLAPDRWNPGVTREINHASPDELEEIGYRTDGWPTGLEELVMVVELEDDTLGEISFSKPTADGGFTTEEVDHVRPFVSLFQIALAAVWQQVRTVQPGNLSLRLEKFGQDLLSPRECEVVQLVLKGHSSGSIALNLEVALTTVKTHRRNAYAKLGIATQQELFSRFLIWQDAELVKLN